MPAGGGTEWGLGEAPEGIEGPHGQQVPDLSDLAERLIHLQEKLPWDILQSQEVLSKHRRSETTFPCSISAHLSPLPGHNPRLPGNHLPIPKAPRGRRSELSSNEKAFHIHSQRHFLVNNSPL